MNTLRALFGADAANREARYNAAFALGEVSETLIAMGDGDSAERNLHAALEILEPSSDSSLSAAKVLRAVDYFRLGRISARRAADPQTGRGSRMRHCAAARGWFDRSRPILAAAELDEQWGKQLNIAPSQIDRELAACPVPQHLGAGEGCLTKACFDPDSRS
jgi:hypothetical protein